MARTSKVVKVRKMSRQQLQQRLQMQGQEPSNVRLLQRDLAQAMVQVRILKEQVLDDNAKYRILQNIRAESRELQMDLSYLETLRLTFPDEASRRLALARLRL